MIVDRSVKIAESIAKTARKLVVPVLTGWMALAPLALAQQMDAPTLPEAPGKAESKLPDVENGKKLARTLCTACHLIGEPANAPVPSDVPTFPSIANRPGQSADHLSTWLTRPHPPMPNLNLTRTEIRDLTGYILSLRTEK